MSAFKQKGQGLVEFALVLPVLLLLVFGIIAFGRIFQAYLTVQHAAREGARYHVTGRQEEIEGGAHYARVDSTIRHTWESALGIGKTRHTQDTAYREQSDQPYWFDVSIDPPDGGEPGEEVTITVEYNLPIIVPLVDVYIGRGFRLTGQATMVSEPYEGSVLPDTLPVLPSSTPPTTDPTPSGTLFTDASGTEKDFYSLGLDLVYVTVTDGDENADPLIRESIVVVVTDDDTGDSETLTLWETGDDTGVFRNESGLSSSVDSASVDNGNLETADGNTITVTYTDKDSPPADTSSDTALMSLGTPSETRFTDVGGSDMDAYYIGSELIYVTVSDDDENTNPSTPQSFTVTISDTVGGDSETLTLTETGNDTGVFRNAGLSSQIGLANAGDGILQTAIGRVITVSYTDDENPLDQTSDTATMRSQPTPSTIRFSDSGGGNQEEFTIGVGDLFVTVDDPDQNTSPNYDYVYVVITDGTTADEEGNRTTTIQLRETGPTTGQFRNQVGFTSSRDAAGTPNNGNLETGDDNVIQVNYVDPDDPTDDQTDTATMVAQPTDSTTTFTDASEDSVAEYVIGEDLIFVTVEDADENEDYLAAETVVVIISDATSGDSVTLTLIETGPSLGIFRNTTGLESSTDTVDTGDYILQTQPGNTITVDYTDDDDGTDTSSDTATMGSESTTRFTDSLGNDVTSYFMGGGDIFVTVEDADENTSSSSQQTVNVTLTDAETGDSETLTLTETGDDTGVFRNTTGLQSIADIADPENGTLETGVNNTITATYTDDDTSTDTSSDTATITGRSNTLFTDSGGSEQDVFIVGNGDIFVTVEDADENTNSSTQQVISVLVRDLTTGDSETVTLTETGNNTGVFRNTVGLQSSTDAVVTGDGTLQTEHDHTIWANYTDDDDPSDTSSDSALMNVSAGPADLLITSVTLDTGTCDVTVVVENQGNQNVASTFFSVDLYLDPPGIPGLGNRGNHWQWFDNIQAGASRYITFTNVAFDSTGSHTMYAQVDTTDNVVEVSEVNNVYGPETVADVGSCWAPPTATPTSPPPTATPTSLPTECDDQLVNGDFESGTSPWQTDCRPWHSCNLIFDNSYYAHSPSHGAVAGGRRNADDRVWQENITIPGGVGWAKLTYWRRVESSFTDGDDCLQVQVRPQSGGNWTTLETVCGNSPHGTYIYAEQNLDSYIGQAIMIRFRGTNDRNRHTYFLVDDVRVCIPEPAAPTPTATATPVPATITGVTRASMGPYEPPIGWVSVGLYYDDGTPIEEVISDANGNYSFTGLDPNQTYRIEAYTWLEGTLWTALITGIQLDPGETRNIDVILH